MLLWLSLAVRVTCLRISVQISCEVPIGDISGSTLPVILRGRKDRFLWARWTTCSTHYRAADSSHAHLLLG